MNQRWSRRVFPRRSFSPEWIEANVSGGANSLATDG